MVGSSLRATTVVTVLSSPDASALGIEQHNGVARRREHGGDRYD